MDLGKDRQTDRQTDRPAFIGPFQLKPGGLIKRHAVIILEEK